MKSLMSILTLTASMALTAGCATANGDEPAARATDDEVTVDEERYLYRVDGPRHIEVRLTRSIDAVLENYDEDDDGKISREEYGAKPNRNRFDELDANDDGFVDRAELEKSFGQRVHGRAMRHHGGEGGWEAFAHRFDENGDLVIELDEIDDAMAKHLEEMEKHLAEMRERAGEQSRHILEMLDENGDLKIEMDEFDFDFDSEAFKERMKKHRAERLKRMDEDGDGVISQDEFAKRRIERFKELDKNKDGKLDAEELESEMFDGHDFAMHMPREFGPHFLGRNGEGPFIMRFHHFRDRDDEGDKDDDADAEK